jgi:hypothetical protein
MKTMVTAMLIAGALAILSTAASAQRSQRPQDGPISQEAYNRCYQLALSRGQNTSVGDRYNLELFMSACLRGKIPY